MSDHRYTIRIRQIADDAAPILLPKCTADQTSAPLLRRGKYGFAPCNAAAERLHEVHSILRTRRGLLARYRYAGLFLLEHLDDGYLVAYGDHLRHLAGHAGTMPPALDEFGRCVVCVRLGWFRLNA